MKPGALRFRNIRDWLPWVIWVAIGLLLLPAGARAEINARPLRVGLPHSVFHMEFALVADWQRYLQNKLRRPVEFVDNRKFADSVVQLHMGKLDFAWVTDYPNPAIGFQARLVVVPLYKGTPFFISYLVVPATDTRTTTLKQLRGQVMVYANPTSSSHIDHRYALLNAGEHPRRFFRKVFFTYANHESIEAVVLGLADVAEVDNYAWDAMVEDRPEVTLQTRILARSGEFGAPPLMANHFVGVEDFANMQNALVGMAHDPEGIKLLKRMRFDGFVPGDARFYQRLVSMKKALGEQ